MSSQGVVPAVRRQNGTEQDRTQFRAKKASKATVPTHFPARIGDVEAPYRHAELFYLQKQIQTQTPMIIILEDGEQIEGCIEWYDRNSVKVRGRVKSLIYKAAIKYMYKQGDSGQG